MRVFSSLAVFALAGALLLGVSACSEKKATPEDAKAMALRAATYLREMGPEVALAEFTDGGKWRDGDLYVWVNDSKGVSVAHGFQPELIGTNELDVPDADGKYYMHDVVAIEDQGWVDYHWKSPTTGEIVPKTSYIVRVGDYLVGVGAYKY